MGLSFKEKYKYLSSLKRRFYKLIEEKNKRSALCVGEELLISYWTMANHVEVGGKLWDYIMHCESDVQLDYVYLTEGDCDCVSHWRCYDDRTICYHWKIKKWQSNTVTGEL